MTTAIEWTDETWNPVTGCTPISEGCAHCYAKRMARRLAGRCGYPDDGPFKVTLHRDRLEEPLRWRKSRRVFVCSMGDLFHPDVPWDFIADVWLTMAMRPRHTFQVLTKRPARMREWALSEAHEAGPMPHIWLGVTAENLERADERIPLLMQTPAARRFVSVEPMLEPITLRDEWRGLDWVICGGETGPGAREMHPAWARDLRDQCTAANVPFFMKKMSGGTPPPKDLQIREWPR